MSVNTLDRDVARLLQEGQDAARRGDKAMARALLTQLVEQDPRNEEAWMWLSGVVTDPDEQQICLENALVINPDNAHARKGLEFVLTKTNTPARVPLAPPAPPVSPVATPSTNLASAQLQVSANVADVAQLPEAPQAWETSGPTMPRTVAPPAPEPVAFASSIIETEHPESEFTAEAMAAGNPDHTSPIGSVLDNQGSFALATEDVPVDLDAEPFIPPGMDEMEMDHPTTPPALDGTLLNSTADQIGEELPSWLQDLTPTMPTSHQAGQEGGFSPFHMDDFPGQQPSGSSMPAPNAINGTGSSPAPAQPFGPSDFPDFGDLGMSSPSMGNPGMASPMSAPAGGPVGPFSEAQMPAPHELPGGSDGFSSSSKGNTAQPWYLQGSSSSSQHGNGSAHLDSTMLKSTSLDSAMLTSSMDQHRLSKPVATMPCPNCRTDVPETSLACPNCRYSFFVNCPYCHELIDTSDAVPDNVEPCPYCAKEVNKWLLGLGGAPDLVSQKNPGSRPADAGPGPDPAFPAMKQTLAINTALPKRPSFAWVVDLLWLVAIVAMVWALTQLPTWLHLSGLY